MPFCTPVEPVGAVFLRERFNAEPLAVRAALLRVECGGLLAPLAAEHRDCVLLVLAEVLNNVAEHAYGGAPGPVAFTLRRWGQTVLLRVADRGGAALLPGPARPRRAETLPEGGFGLGLIRALARDVTRGRRLGCNVLRLRIPHDNPALPRGIVSNPKGRSQKKPDFPLNPPPDRPITSV